MAKTTLLDIAKLNGNDRVVGLIEENLTYAPEMNLFPARTVSGTSYHTIVRTGFPSVGFRNANEGVTPSKSSFRKQLTELFILSSAIEVDKAVAAAYEDGPAAWEMIEADGVMRQTMITMGSQIWYGTSADAKGFAGIKSLVPKNSTISVDATGAAANTASSVYAVKFGVQNVSLVFGQNTTLELSDFRDQQLTDDSGGKYAGRVADLTGWAGLSVLNNNCIGRILNLTAENGKGLTDSLLADLFNKFPVGYVPDAIFMSRRSRSQLQKSRSVTLFGQGTNRPQQPLISPIPTEYDGVPIIVSDSIRDTDAIE